MNEEYGPLKVYALIVEGELACYLRFPSKGVPRIEMVNAALSSNPIVIDATDMELFPEASGWTWDGEEFKAPVVNE